MSNLSFRPCTTDQAHAEAIYQTLMSSPSSAWKETRPALKNFPQSERVQFVAGLVQIARGKKNEARMHFAKAIKLGTATPDAYINLAQLSAETGKLTFAVDTLDRAAAKFGDTLQLLLTRITVFRLSDDPAHALEASNKAISTYPESPDVRFVHGLVLAENGRLLDAIDALETLTTAHPNHVDGLLKLSHFYAFSNQTDNALAISKRAYEIDPSRDEAIENLAARKRESGDFEGSSKLFWQLAESTPAFAPEAYSQLADIVPLTELAPLKQAIEAYKVRAPEERAQLDFARAGVAKRLEHYEAYEASITRANRVMAKLRPYDAAQDEERHTRVLEQFSTETSAIEIDHSLPAKPIFIMGLPRSGTTLLERMLTMVPDVSGLGEVALINRWIAQGLCASIALNGELYKLRKEYVRFQNCIGASTWTVDKMPSNYMNIGWIKRAFPEAKLIVLRRDAKDLALSIFENYFDDPGQNFSFEEARIQARFALFEKTLTDWKYLGLDFLEINYEDLVSDPQETLTQVSAYCGLPYDAAMLSPETNSGSIRTASSVQARHGISQSSVARWKKTPNLLPRIFRASASDWANS